MAVPLYYKPALYKNYCAKSMLIVTNYFYLNPQFLSVPVLTTDYDNLF